MNTSTAVALKSDATVQTYSESHATAVVISKAKQHHRSKLLEWSDILAAFDAEPNRDAVKYEYAQRMGKSVATLYRKYYLWQSKGADALVPKYAKTKTTALDPQFVFWFKGLFESINSNSIPQARRVMMQRLQRGDSIPGLGTWRDLYTARFPDVPPPRGIGREYPGNNLETLMPRSYSQRNLLRFKAELLEVTAAKQGSWASSGLGSMVYTTRVGLKYGQILCFDDVWHNQNCNYMNGKKAVRPIELCCIDFLSGDKVAWGARPRLWNEETQRHEGIKEHEFRFLLAYTLCEAVGYRRDGTILWLERGTAAVDQEMTQLLYTLSNGAITVRAAPLKDARQSCSIFKSVASGNPRYKARLESNHHVAQILLSGIQGQIGRNANVRPEEICGRDKYNELMLKIASLLPPELASRLELPYLEWSEYMECVHAAYEELAWRDWHKLEGWEALKFFKKMYCLPGTTQWLPLEKLLDMDPQSCQDMYNILERHPEYCQIKAMSPREVTNRYKHELIRLPKCAMPLILGVKNGTVRQCPESAELRFESRLLGPAPHIYSRRFTDNCGDDRRLDAGRNYLFHINPFSPSRELFISDPDGAYLGCTTRIDVPCQADHERTMDRIKVTRQEWNQTLRTVGARHIGKLAKEAAAMKMNTDIVNASVREGLIPGGKKAVVEIAANESTDILTAEAEDADAAVLSLYGN